MKNTILEKMLHNPTGLKLMILNRVLTWMIPFNAPHGFYIQKLIDGEVQIKLPYKRKNLNHIKGIHACAIATVGEFCAGMSLLQSFSPNEYRLILSKLNVEYIYQAKTAVFGNIKKQHAKIGLTKSEIQKNGKAMIELETILTDEYQNIIAKVQTIWQIKSWHSVQTKL